MPIAAGLAATLLVNISASKMVAFHVKLALAAKRT
jgi:hypothetical protein